MTSDIRVNRSVVIPGDELDLKFTTSGGPGGQHANKSATRVELAWNVAASSALGPRQRERVMNALRSRIDSTGTLRLASSRRRSQLRNREDVMERLAELVADALVPPVHRVPTVTPKAAVRRRVESKRRRGEIKKMRAKPTRD